MPIDLSLIEPVILTCVEKNPVDFRNVAESEVKKVQTAIRRATVEQGATFRNPVTRKNFLCGCLGFTDKLPEEHLIVGYGYRNRSTTAIERVHHVVGEEREVAIPDYVRAQISQHHFHQTDAEVIVFHNHPRTGNEPQWLYALKSLVQDLPIASNADRRALQYHAFNPVGILRHVLGQGRVLFYLGESGFVKQIQLPPMLSFLKAIETRCPR